MLDCEEACVEPILRGLLDVGVAELPMLREVKFELLQPEHCTSDVDPDPLPPLLRRFLHRDEGFPNVAVLLDMISELWEDIDQWHAFVLQFVSWPRVRLYSAARGIIPGPPSPHASDDEEGSGVD